MPEEEKEEEQKKEREFLDEDLTGIRKPILPPATWTQVRAATAQFNNRALWKKWGMHKLRKQGNFVLMEGPPGTGKTITAKWMAKDMGKKMKMLHVATICSGEPGASEREVIRFFNACKDEDCVVYMDEADMLLGDRNLISADGRTWQLSTQEQIMMELNVFPGLVIASTNHPESLDEAMADRCLYIIKFQRPDLRTRRMIWKQKWPKTFPLKLKEEGFKELAKHDLSGRQIENAIIAAASECIEGNITPTLAIFNDAAGRQAAKRLKG